MDPGKTVKNTDSSLCPRYQPLICLRGTAKEFEGYQHLPIHEARCMQKDWLITTSRLCSHGRWSKSRLYFSEHIHYCMWISTRLLNAYRSCATLPSGFSVLRTRRHPSASARRSRCRRLHADEFPPTNDLNIRNVQRHCALCASFFSGSNLSRIWVSWQTTLTS